MAITNHELAAHRVTFEEAVECFFSDFEIRRNKSYRESVSTPGTNGRRAAVEDHFSTEAGRCCPDHYRMATMRTKKKAQPLTEREIDNIVVAQADDDTAWGKPVRVRKAKTASVPLPSALATRVAFFARLHREKSIEAWLERIIQDRLDLEEAAFAGLKRELATRYSSSQNEL